MGDFVDESRNTSIDKEMQMLEDFLLSSIKSNLGHQVFQSLEKDSRKEVYGYVQLLKGLIILSIFESYTETQFKLALKELWKVIVIDSLMSSDQQSQFTSKVTQNVEFG